ncbi:MAG: hypothetical protein WCP57_06060 [Bacteroidota bacterium]
MGNELVEILKYTIPAIISLAATVIVVWLFMKKDEDYRRFEIAVKNRDTTLPLRLQSYERLTLLLERLEPNSLITRLLPSDMSAKEYQMILIATIKAEFEHNLSQQIYVSSTVWNAVVVVKNDLLKTVIIKGTELGSEGTGSQLSRAILNHYMELETGSPNGAALELIRNEVKSVF